MSEDAKEKMVEENEFIIGTIQAQMDFDTCYITIEKYRKCFINGKFEFGGTDGISFRMAFEQWCNDIGIVPF